jgi:hypothetical protein
MHYVEKEKEMRFLENEVPLAWVNSFEGLVAYILQGDLHNRLTPRIIDVAYTAFMLAKQPNKEDGGESDWFNDTRPAILKMITKIGKDLEGYKNG